MDLELQAIEKKIEIFFEESLWLSKKSDFLSKISNDVLKQVSVFFQKKKKSPYAISIKIKSSLKNDLSRREISHWEIFLKRIIIEEMSNNQIPPHQSVQVQVDFIDGAAKDYQIEITNSSPDRKKTATIEIHHNDLSNTIVIPGYLIIPDNKIYEINKPIINIGRREDNDLVLENLRISRVHAQIRQIEDKHIIFDLDSTLGTKVNGDRVSQKILTHGDVIEIADIALIYDTDSERKPDLNSKRTRIIKTDLK